jgi:hypothetical protein
MTRLSAAVRPIRFGGGSAVRALAWTLQLTAAAGLIIDAWVHGDLASHYDVVRASISEGDLFRLEAVIALLVAVLVLFWSQWFIGVLAFLVAASAVGALLLSTYTDPGPLGPLPDMYEPTWFAEKQLALIAEIVAAVASLGYAAVMIRARSRLPKSGVTRGGVED